MVISPRPGVRLCGMSDVEQFVRESPYEGQCPTCGATTISTFGAILDAGSVTCPNGHTVPINQDEWERGAAEMRARIEDMRRGLGS